MVLVTLYTRRGCHLCDDARAVLDAARARHAFELAVLDIDSDPTLLSRYSDQVPVIAIDGRAVFTYRVTLDALLDRVRGAETSAA